MMRLAFTSIVSFPAVAANSCNIVEAWSGQQQIVVPGCKGTGCNANGADWDCAWCVTDLKKCKSAYGDACDETVAARSAQGASCGDAPEMKNIVEIAEATAALSTLVSAVVAGDLVDTLISPGPFTVFAPTNAAFAALPDGTVDSLMKPENKDTLVDILTYHVVGAAALSTDLSDGQMIETVEGKSVVVSIADGTIMINNANVVIPDVMASNGVVHVIDAVLIPPVDANPVDVKNIVELAQATEALSTLVAAVVAGDLVETLSSPGPFTVFAPTNDAFAALPEGTLDTLLKPEGKDVLVDILTYHVVGAKALSTDLSDGQMIETVEGKSVTVSIGDGVMINNANVVIPDVMASNGVVHVIDAVLIPPVDAKNIVELAQATKALSTLVAAVVAGDLVETLSSPGPFTVFAPTNDAFAALPEGTLDTLLKPEGKDSLVDILTYHVVGAKALSTDLSDGQEIETVEGKSVTVSIGDGVMINNANVVIADVVASNGVVHVIDAVLIPPTIVV